MFIVVSHLNPEPMYKQITDQVKDAVVSGAINPGDKLPSIRSIAEELKISVITVKRAYADLEQEGYIYTRSGLGSFVAGIDKEEAKMTKIKEIKQELKSIIIKGEKFAISSDDIIRIIHEIKEETNE